MTNPNDLLGVKHNPPGFDAVRAMSRTAKAYHALAPYPAFSDMTKTWKQEDRGPFPRCQPFVKRIVLKGARWLFGRGVTFRVPDDEASSELVNEVWTCNDMTRRGVAMAQMGAMSGGAVLKWSLVDKEPKIHILDPAEHTRLYWDESDTSKLLMARVQYPIFDPVKGIWNWYREEWTDTTFRVYQRLPMSEFQSKTWTDPYQMAEFADISDRWEVESEKPNPFGLIPLWYIRNQDVGREYGEGDLWSCYHIVDQINFSIDLAHKHNQRYLDPEKAYIDLQAPTDDAPNPGGPGSAEVVETKEGAPAQGKVQILQVDASMREPLRQFALDLKRDLFETVGSVDLDPKEVTNKGNLTSAVLAQLYAPLIEATDSKRVCYGEDGVCVFFERMSQGLSKIKAEGWKPLEDVQIHWPPYWKQPEDELMAGAQRQAFLYQNRFTTHERAVQETAKADGIVDVDDLLEEIEKEPDPAGMEAGGSSNEKAKDPRSK